MIRLNLGAGRKVIPGWVSVGLEPQHEFQCDLRTLETIPNDYADEAMGIHVIEHIHRWEVPSMLLEWRRVLKHGAKLAIECPDLLKCCRNILKGLPRQEGIQGLFGEWELKDPMMMHVHGWTEAEMRQVLEEAGFSKIAFTTPLFHGRRAHRDLRVEAIKP